MKSFSGRALALTAALLCICGIVTAQEAPESPAPLGDVLRAPSYPLVVHDPLFSIWSSTDNPGTDYTKHWAGQISCITVMANVDGKTYMLMGKAPKVPHVAALVLFAPRAHHSPFRDRPAAAGAQIHPCHG